MALAQGDRFTLARSSDGVPLALKVGRPTAQGDRFTLVRGADGVPLPAKVEVVRSQEDRGMLVETSDGVPILVKSPSAGGLYVAGSFTNVGGVRGQHAEKRADGWHLSGDGMNGTVYAYCEFGGALYCFGDFTQDGQNTVTYGRWAKWNATTEKWDDLDGAGFNGTVYDAMVFNGELVVCGAFSTMDGNAMRRVAAWNGTTWRELGDGFNSNGYRLINHGGVLWCCGAFTKDGPGVVNLKYVAYYDPVGDVWVQPGNGADNAIWGMASFNSDLYVCGFFVNMDGTGIKYVAKWTAGAWARVGASDFNTYCRFLLEHDGRLYMAGLFTTYGGAPMKYIARLNNSTGEWVKDFDPDGVINAAPGLVIRGMWLMGSQLVVGYVTTDATKSDVTLGAQYMPEFSGTAWALRIDEGWNAAPHGIYVYGDRTFFGGGTWALSESFGFRTSHRVAKLNLTTGVWSTLGTAQYGLWKIATENIGSAAGLTEYDGKVICFAASSDSTKEWGRYYDPADNEWKAWPEEGKGVFTWSAGVYFNGVRGIVIDPVDGKPVIYGGFSAVDGVAVPGCAKWNPDTGTFSDFFGGAFTAPAVGKYLTALACIDGIWYASGTMTQLNGADATKYFAYRTEDLAWHAINTTIDEKAHCIIADPNVAGDILFGGRFTGADGKTLNGFCRYTPGDTTFNPIDALGANTGVTVATGWPYCALLDADGNVLFGGTITEVKNGPVVAWGLVKWDGAALTAIGKSTAGTNLYGQVFDMTLIGGVVHLMAVAFTETDVRGQYISIGNLVTYDSETDAFVPLGITHVGNPFSMLYSEK